MMTSVSPLMVQFYGPTHLPSGLPVYIDAILKLSNGTDMGVTTHSYLPKAIESNSTKIPCREEIKVRQIEISSSG